MVGLSNGEALLRLVIAMIFSGLIGLERESSRKWAGFRTHILVGVGSALVMMISLYGYASPQTVPRDPFRLAAQVVSGIGFLGAGTILHQGANVRGLTTAATLWVVSAIGLATGAGMFVPAFFASVLVFLILTYIYKMEKVFIFKRYRKLTVQSVDKPGLIGQIGTILGDERVNIYNVEVLSLEAENDVRIIELKMDLDVPRNFIPGEILRKLADLEGVKLTSID